MNPTSYNVGDKVKVTQASFLNAENEGKSFLVYPSTDFLEKFKLRIGQEATVLYRHRPGYEITIQFNDSRAFHCKDNWVEKV